MREWRKVWGPKVIASDKLAVLGYEARWLWLLFVLGQDDEGKYPYTRMNLKALTVATEWSWDDCQRLTEELSEAGLVTVDDDFIYVTNGAGHNGRLRSDRPAFLYRSASRSLDNKWVTSGEPASVYLSPGDTPEETEEKEKESKTVGEEVESSRSEEERQDDHQVNRRTSRTGDWHRRNRPGSGRAWDGPNYLSATEILARKAGSGGDDASEQA